MTSAQPAPFFRDPWLRRTREAAWAAALKSPIGIVSAILIIVLAVTVFSMTASYDQVTRMTDVSTSIDTAQADLVLAYDGLMDADQGVHRFSVDRTPASVAHFTHGVRQFREHIYAIIRLTSQNKLDRASAATAVLDAAFNTWFSTYASPEMSGHVAVARLARPYELIDVTQENIHEVSLALIAARQMQIDRVQANRAANVAFVAASLALLAVIGLLVDYLRRRDQAANVRALEARAGALQQSNAALQEFAYVASHDLQEPLRMVSSYTQLLSRRYRGKLDSDADEFIAFAVDGAKRMQNLIQDILEYSRVDASVEPLRPVRAQAALEDALTNLSGAIADTNAVVSRAELPCVVGDRRQLGQLFQNLIGNALKYRGEATPVVHVEAEAEDEMVRFAIRDNGIGIEPQYFERVFRMFQRLHAKAAYSGTGIGLAVCKRIVERHGGRMWVTSTPGDGSTFYFTLRAAARSAA